MFEYTMQYLQFACMSSWIIWRKQARALTSDTTAALIFPDTVFLCVIDVLLCVPAAVCPVTIMASGALFPSMVSGSRGSSSKYLVEFRAGKMTMKGSTVTPDKRKGQVYIQQTDDSLIHFCWKDRTTGNVDDVG